MIFMNLVGISYFSKAKDYTQSLKAVIEICLRILIARKYLFELQHYGKTIDALSF